MALLDSLRLLGFHLGAVHAVFRPIKARFRPAINPTILPLLEQQQTPGFDLPCGLQAIQIHSRSQGGRIERGAMQALVLLSINESGHLTAQHVVHAQHHIPVRRQHILDR